MSQRFYYALEYAYGAGTINNGQRADRIHRFATQQRRAKAMLVGPAFATESGYLDAIPASDPRVLRAKKEAKLLGHWPEEGIPVS